MTEMILDTQKMVDRLEAAGVPPAQARAHAALLFEVINSVDEHCTDRYATNEAVTGAVDGNNAEFAAVRAEFVAVRAEMQAGLSKLRSDLMKWVLVVGVSLSVLQTAFTSALILKLLP